MSTWRVEHLRATAFTTVADTAALDSVWSELVGAPADRIDHRPKEGVVIATGPFEGAALSMLRKTERTDFVWTLGEEAVASEQLPSIGEFGKIEKPFLAVANKWLANSSTTNRLAWGGVLVLPVSSKVNGYEILAGFLQHVKIDPVGSEDFQYRINRPRSSKIIDGLRINRLSTWAVAVTRTLTITAAVATPGPESHVCRMQFDINTDAARVEPLPRDALVALLDEMVHFALEIASHGDVP